VENAGQGPPTDADFLDSGEARRWRSLSAMVRIGLVPVIGCPLGVPRGLVARMLNLAEARLRKLVQLRSPRSLTPHRPRLAGSPAIIFTRGRRHGGSGRTERTAFPGAATDEMRRVDGRGGFLGVGRPPLVAGASVNRLEVGARGVGA